MVSKRLVYFGILFILLLSLVSAFSLRNIIFPPPQNQNYDCSISQGGDNYCKSHFASNYICENDKCTSTSSLLTCPSGTCSNGKMCINGYCRSSPPQKCSYINGELQPCPYNLTCIGDVCTVAPSCKFDTDCGQRSLYACDNGKCVDKKPQAYCLDNCDNSPFDLCRSTNQCGIKLCDSEIDCLKGSICNQGICIKPQCGNDFSTSASNIYGFCGLSNQVTCSLNLCFPKQCGSNTQCGIGNVCYSGICLVKQCLSSSNCGNGNTCINGICEKINCFSDTDCSSRGMTCDQGQCTVKLCSKDSQCPGGNRQCIDGACQYVEPTICTKNDDCASGKVCDVSQSLCVPRQCTPPFTEGCAEGQLCDNGLCKNIGCFNDNSCPGQICSGGKCTVKLCNSNTDCPGSPARICLNNICQTKLCTNNSECPTEFSCNERRCTQNVCSIDLNCGTDKTCDNGLCINKIVEPATNTTQTGIYCSLTKPCPQIQCVRAPCPSYTCIYGECIMK